MNADPFRDLPTREDYAADVDHYREWSKRMGEFARAHDDLARWPDMAQMDEPEDQQGGAVVVAIIVTWAAVVAVAIAWFLASRIW